MSNVFERLDEKWFVPDAQIVFPSVFLSDVENLVGISVLYKKCFDIIKESSNYILLPSNITDFTGIILNKLRNFLSYIESHIRKARNEKWTEAQFYRRTKGYLRSINTFGSNLGDLLTYWENNKELFWSYVLRDYALVKKKMMSLVIDKLGLFASICEDHEIKFTATETDYSDKLFVSIRNAQNTSAITSTANDADLMILSDCIVYVGERLAQGIVYLVTNDKGLHDITLEIIEKPKLILPDVGDTRLVGLEPLYPKRLVDDYNSKSPN